MKTVNLVTIGDSLTLGNHVNPGEGYVDLIGDALPTITITNIAVGSSTIDSAGQGATADAAYNASKRANIVTVLFGNNDMGGGQSAVDFQAELKQFCLDRRAAGFLVIVLTNIGATAAGFNTVRNANNVLTRADPSYYDALADVAADATIGTDAAPSNGSLFSDGIHPTALGNTYIEPYVTAAIQALAYERLFYFKR